MSLPTGILVDAGQLIMRSQGELLLEASTPGPGVNVASKRARCRSRGCNCPYGVQSQKRKQASDNELCTAVLRRFSMPLQSRWKHKNAVGRVAEMKLWRNYGGGKATTRIESEC